MSGKKPKIITMSGADYREFYHDKGVWGDKDEGWLDDDDIRVDGETADFEPDSTNCPDNSIVTFSFGSMVDGPNNGKDLADVARKWLSRRTHITLIVRAKKDNVEAIKNAVSAAGGEVVV